MRSNGTSEGVGITGPLSEAYRMRELSLAHVGIYTVLRHEDAGYVSVGFPLPHGNFTATLLPFANRNGDLLLKSESSHPYTGHYLSAVEDEADSLTTLRLRNFAEEIDVYVENGELITDHRFFLNGIRFLTLHYTIERKPSQ